MKSPVSPILTNSTFAQLDYFNERPTSMIRPITPLPIINEVDLGTLVTGSPMILASPSKPIVSAAAAAAARRSVQIQEGGSVNWARPLRKEQDSMTREYSPNVQG